MTTVFDGVVDCLDTTNPGTPAVVCVNDGLAIDAPVSDQYSYTVSGNLAATEGSPYSVVVTAVASPGFEFAPDAVTEWNFDGVVDCLGVASHPPPSTTTPTTTPVNPVVAVLPRTGASSTSILLAYASILMLSGGFLMLIRRSARRPVA